jgi:hypothetical protein
MTTPWMHPLERAARVLTVRMLELETKLPVEANDPGWQDYIQTLQTLTGVLQALDTPAADKPTPITRRQLADRFKQKATS